MAKIPPTRPRLIRLGHIAGAHGIRGEVLIKTETAEPEAIAAYGPLQDEAGQRRFEIRIVRVTPKGVVARLAGVADRTAAECLKGIALYIERERLPGTGEEEFYHADLVGLAAVDATGKTIGRIVAIQNFGAGDLIEVALAGVRRTELVAFTRATVPEIDITGGRVVVVLPAVADDDETGDRQP